MAGVALRPGLAFCPGNAQHQGVPPIAAAPAAASASNAGPAVLAVLAVIAVWWLATHGKGEIKLRLIAWLLLPLIVWALIAAQNPAEAGRIAGGAASGAALAISTIGKVVSGA